MPRQEEKQALEQEVTDLTNCWLTERIAGDRTVAALDEYKEVCRLQAEFISEKGLGEEFRGKMQKILDSKKT